MEPCFCARELILKLLIRYPACYFKLCELKQISPLFYFEQLTINYLGMMKADDHEHIKLVF